MIRIDGSLGEGGGQILRTALGLSMATGTPVAIDNIRAGRTKPGLLRQHLTAVEAATRVSGADVSGAALGSQTLVFRPGPVVPGDHTFAVGTAGSATLVLQTVLPALLTAAGPSTLRLEGGTHNPWAPPFEFLEQTFLPLIQRMGPTVDVRLERRGFYPAGGGRFTMRIEPVDRLRPLELAERGATGAITARAVVASLPSKIGERELTVLRERLRLPRIATHVIEDDASLGPGNVLLVTVPTAHVTEVFTGFGERGVRAEAVADRVAKAVARYLAADVPVGEHLADQLLVPLALAGGGRFVTVPPSSHTQTNIDVVRQFLDVPISVESHGPAAARVTLGR